MKASTINDTCYCTLNGGANPFNMDGKPRTSIDLAEARAALDFEIQKRPSYGYKPETREYIEIPNQFHLVRDTDGAFIPSKGVGLQFQPVQHRDIFDNVVNEILPNFPEMKLETCGTLYGGGTGLMTFKVGDLFHIKGDHSPSEMRLFISNPCNGDGSLVMGFTTVRLFCRNQLAAAKRTAMRDGYWIRHTRSAKELVGNAVEHIGLQMQAANELKARCERLAELAFDRAEFEQVLDTLYPLNKLVEGTAGYTRMVNLRNEALEQFDGGKTASEMDGTSAWTAFNAISYPVYNPQKLGSRTDLANIDYQAMAGTKAEKVRKAFEVVERVAIMAA